MNCYQNILVHLGMSHMRKTYWHLRDYEAHHKQGQLCAGHDAGCEATDHAMKCIFDDETPRESFL